MKRNKGEARRFIQETDKELSEIQDYFSHPWNALALFHLPRRTNFSRVKERALSCPLCCFICLISVGMEYPSLVQWPMDKSATYQDFTVAATQAAQLIGISPQTAINALYHVQDEWERFRRFVLKAERLTGSKVSAEIIRERDFASRSPALRRRSKPASNKRKSTRSIR